MNGKIEDRLINEVVKKLKRFNPTSIFIYGSRAKGDFIDNSDYEIGIIFNDANYINRASLNKLVRLNKVHIYPFRLKDLQNYNVDTPFPKRIYIRELFFTAKIIHGENIFRKLKAPSIFLVDLINEIYFSLARALDSLILFRNNEIDLAKELFVKSMFYGFRAFLVFKLRRDVFSYREIFDCSKNILDEYCFNVLQTAYDIRYNKFELNIADIFRGITCLNKKTLPELTEHLDKKGNNIIVQ